jgi:Toxin SymE, type I toxin-antitoxin system
MDTTHFEPRYITMSDHTPTDRHSLHDFDLPGPKAVPCLRIAGKWLRTAGFEDGMKVRIEVSKGRLVIEPCSSSP